MSASERLLLVCSVAVMTVTYHKLGQTVGAEQVVVQDSVQTKKLEIINNDGKAIITLDADGFGHGRLRMTNDKWPVIELGMPNRRDGAMMLRDKDGNAICNIFTGEDGRRSLVLYDRAGEIVASISEPELGKGSLRLYDANTKAVKVDLSAK